MDPDDTPTASAKPVPPVVLTTGIRRVHGQQAPVPVGVSSAVWIGVDPGGRHTGVVVRHGQLLLAHDVLTRVDPGPWPDGRYLASVLACIDGFRSGVYGRSLRVALEGLRRPSWRVHGKVKPVDPAAPMALAVTYGAILSHFPDALIVPPGGHATAPLRAYPPDLVGRRERKGTGIMVHCRAAWDIAGAAVLLDRPGRTR